MKNKQLLKKILSCLSFALILNYLFWIILLNKGYFYPNVISELFKCLLINIIFFGLFYFLLIKMVESKKKILKILGIILVFFLVIVLVLGLCLIAGISPYRFFLHRKIALICLSIILIFLCRNAFLLDFYLLILPFGLFFLFDLAITYHSNQSTLFAKKNKEINSPRVVLMIFDEFDYHLTFQNETSPLNLKNLNALKNKSFFATEAIQPDGHTIRSMTAYLSGKPLDVKTPQIEHFDDISYTTKIGKKFSLKKDKNLFSKVAEMNKNTALYGWAIPYNKIFRKYVCQSSCVLPWESHFLNKNSLKSLWNFNFFLLDQSLNYIYALFKIKNETDNFWDKWNKSDVQSNLVDFHIKTMDKIKEDILKKDIDFIFYHSSFAHYPGIYDEKNNVYLRKESGSYYGNLALIDKTVGEILDYIEQSEKRESTILIITADHIFRKENYQKKSSFVVEDIRNKRKDREKIPSYIPFIVYFPNGSKSIYKKEFNALCLHNMVLKLLNKEIICADDVEKFIDNQTQSH